MSTIKEGILKNEQLFTNNKNDWETPDDLFDHYNSFFNFKWDLACNKNNCKVYRGITDKGEKIYPQGFMFPEDNSLEHDWHRLGGWLWINPPYDELKIWIAKCHQETKLGAKIIALITARLDSKIWQEIIIPNYEFKVLSGRLKFKGLRTHETITKEIVDKNGQVHKIKEKVPLIEPIPETNSATFPSALVKFEKDLGFRRL